MDLVIGPQHPSLHEPERFLFKVDGEVVVDVEPRIGYVHRGIEKAVEERTYIQNLYLIERICGICNACHSLCYCMAAEMIYGAEIPPRSQYIRTILAELNRLHSHLLFLGVVGELLGFHTLFMYLWRDREQVMDIMEEISGNRLIPEVIALGGARRDISQATARRLRRMLEGLKGRMGFYERVFCEDPSLMARLSGIGVLPRSKALELCAVGPTARGSGVRIDVRKDDPYSAYVEIPFEMVVYEEEDSWARVMVRVNEVYQIVDIITYALDHMPEGPLRVKLPRRPPVGEAVGRVECPRGELMHHIISDGTEKPYRFKARTPTLANIPSVCFMFKGNYIADIPAILVSIDPCFSCTDRLMFVDINEGSSWAMSLEGLAERVRKGEPTRRSRAVG